MRFAGIMLCTLQDNHKPTPQLLSLHLSETVSCQVLRTPATKMRLGCYIFRNRLNVAEVLVHVANDVERRYLWITAVRGRFSHRREVAIFNTKRRNDTATNHCSIS